MMTRVKPLVVFESAFPGNLDPRDRASYKSGLFFDEGFGKSSGESLYRVSQYQNKYLGYFRIIPLNVVSILTSSSKEDNSFTIELLPDYVYVLYENTEYLPKELKDVLEKNTNSNLSLMNYLDSFLLGTYTSSTTLRSALVPKINLSNVLSPMDTVSIYLARIPNYLSESVEPIFFGQNPGRVKEIDFRKIAKDKAFKYLYNVGLNVSDLVKLLNRSATFYEKLYVYRKYAMNFIISQVSIGRENITGTLLRKIYAKNMSDRESIRKQEENLFKNFPNSLTEVQQFIGTLLAQKYVRLISRNNRIRQEVLAYINDYYTNDPLSRFISWSAYETMLEVFAEFFGRNYVPEETYLYYNRLRNPQNIVRSIISAFVIDNLLQDAYPQILYSRNIEEIDQALQILSSYLLTMGHNKFLDGPNNFENIRDVYRSGVNALFDLVMRDVKRLKDSGVLNPNIKANEFIDEKVSGIEFKSNQSGDGLSLVLRGHITSISESFSITNNSASKAFRISGKGFEHPLESHEIFFDKVSIKLVSQPIENFSVAISDPVSAVKRILRNFAPQRVTGKNIDADTLNVKIIQDRGFDVFVRFAKGWDFSKYVYVIHGNTIAPNYLSDYDELKIFTPIHYVSTNLMSALEDVYKGLSISQAFFGINRNLPDRASVLQAMKDAVSYNSLYRLFVNQFGELNLTFDISSISVPFSLSIIPPITDDVFISGEISSSDQNVSTMVEVVPSALAMSSASSTSLPAIYGRSTAEALYDLFEVNKIEKFDNSRDEGFLKFLDTATTKLAENLLKIVEKIKSNLRSKNKKTKEEEALLSSLETIKSVINRTSRNKINSFLRDETTTTTRNVVTTSAKITEVEKIDTIETCFGQEEKVVKKERKVDIQEGTEKIKETIQTRLFEDNPNLYVIYDQAPQSFFSYLLDSVTGPFYSPVSLRYEVLKADYSEICSGINDLASTYLGAREVCYKENINTLLTFLALGIQHPSREYRSSVGDELNKFIKNYIRRLEIKTSSYAIKEIGSLYKEISSNVIFDRPFSYFKNFFSYIIPSPDIKDIPKTSSGKIYLTNISPDLFLYGLRTKTFQDSFIGTIEAYKNEDKISALRAEMYRVLNKEPIKTLKVTIFGNANYYPSYTTLTVLEEFSPIKGYITKKTLKQIEFDLSQEYRTVIGVNEIVDNPKFQKLYPSLLPKIPGYTPPTQINSRVVEKYLLDSVKYILSKRGFFPAELYIPLFGVYTNPKPKTLIGDFIESIFEYLDLQFPDKAQKRHSDVYNALLNLSISYGGQFSESFEYLKPQNYLVAQGHIESVSHSFSIEGSFDTNLNITYLLPAIYTYIPYKGKKLILGYVVLESPMYLYNDFGNKNKIINLDSQNKKNFYEFMARSTEEAKKHYKEIFSENIINLKLLEIMLE